MATNSRVTLLGILIVTVFLSGLYFIPDLLKQTHYQLGGGIEKPTVQKFPVDIPLQVIRPQNSGKMTLREWAKKTGAKTLIVNFWATWCAPCLEELPSLEFLNRELERASAGSLPKLVTISVDEKSVAVDGLYQSLDYKPTLFVMHDSEGTFARSVGSTKFPETYWITPDGEILHRWIGPQDWTGKEVTDRLKRHSATR